jgi:sugar fermentation stimulation protein A
MGHRHDDPFSVPLFSNVRWGEFLSRPNRFIVECRLQGKKVTAHLPNPGRLWELLLPGQPIALVENTDIPERKTLFTAVAVEKEGRIILLHTQKANAVVKALIELDKIKGLESAHVIRTEVKKGRSRFDLLVQKGRETILVEVKSCTLFGRQLAMFPDAVTERGRKHLLELAAHVDMGVKCRVIFLVHTADLRFFLPDFHTDYAFARTFAAMKDRLHFQAVAVRWDRNLKLSPVVRELTIPWDTLAKESRDRGIYLVLFHIPEDTTIASSGPAGPVVLRTGYYVQVREANEDLSGQMGRYERETRRKKNEGRVAGIETAAAGFKILPIRSGESVSPDLHRMLERISARTLDLPGPSPSLQTDRLYAMNENPLRTPSFIDMLLHFRMDRLISDEKERK